jgi:hypothetical protein
MAVSFELIEREGFVHQVLTACATFDPAQPEMLLLPVRARTVWSWQGRSYSTVSARPPQASAERLMWEGMTWGFGLWELNTRIWLLAVSCGPQSACTVNYMHRLRSTCERRATGLSPSKLCQPGPQGNSYEKYGQQNLALFVAIGCVAYAHHKSSADSLRRITWRCARTTGFTGSIESELEQRIGHHRQPAC